VVDLTSPLRNDALLFGETQSRILVTCRRADLDSLLKSAAAHGVPAQAIGRAGGADLVVKHSGQEILRLPVVRAFRAWKDSLPSFFQVRS